jgi:hypothetical protein
VNVGMASTCNQRSPVRVLPASSVGRTKRKSREQPPAEQGASDSDRRYEAERQGKHEPQPVAIQQAVFR